MGAFLEDVRTALQDDYAVEREIGSGAMATVFLARDLKHDRPVAIKVLKPAVAAAIGAERFLREIDIAAHLNHPHILPLYDSGEANGLLFYVMPYVEGESLRARLEREGELPVRDAARIAMQVASALDYAHAAGVVHRDIKPGNILLSSGEAVVADFGIAQALDAAAERRLTQVGTTPGTIGYMSPEQALGGVVDGRSDVYALGCVLYEMLAGGPPYVGANAEIVLALQTKEPARISATRSSVPDALERIVFRALARLPADRFETAASFAEALDAFATGTGPVVSTPRRRAIARHAIRVTPVLAVAVLAVFLFTQRSGGIDFDERDWIVIADLENTTGDSIFDRSLNTALTVAVDQSQYVNVFPRGRVLEVLRRMGRDAEVRLDAELAREVAIRENLKAVLAFEIAGIEDTYALSTRIIDPATGVAVESASVRADGKSAVLPAVDELATRLRRSLGESLRAIRQRNVPLPQATTSSLEALKRFADGSEAWRNSRWTEARALWEQAVALDSSFAWAHASLGLAANWLEASQPGHVHFARAEGLLDRVTERERLIILSLIHGGRRAVDALQALTQQWPDDRDAWYNLGNMYRTLNRNEDALIAYERSIAVDSMCPWCYVNTGMVQETLGRFAESAESFRRAFELDPVGRTQARGDLNRTYGFVLAALGDTAAARAVFEELLPLDGAVRANGLRSLALLDMYGGHIGKAIEQLRESTALFASLDQGFSEFRNRLYLASLYDLKGRAAAALAERERAERLGERVGISSDWLFSLAKQYARTGQPDRAAAVLEVMEQQVTSESFDYARANVLEIRGEVALARGDHDGAKTLLESAYGVWSDVNRLEALAYAAYRSGRLEEAERKYREVVAQPTLGDEGQMYWIRSHHRLAHVLEQRGDTAGAIEFYGRFLRLWQNGDRDLPDVLAVQERLTRLTAETRGR